MPEYFATSQSRRIRTHPETYSRGVSTTVWDLLHQPVFRVLYSSGGARQPSGAAAAPETPDTIVVGGRRLPRPTEGQRIPAPHEGGPTSPDGSIYTVWTSPTEHHLVFMHPGDEERYIALHQRMDELGANMPDRAGNAHIGASPQPGVALVSSAGPLARARDHRARRSSARRHARSRHPSGRGTARDRPRRVGDSVRPALRRPGGAGVRSSRRRRPSRPAPRVTVKMPP